MKHQNQLRPMSGLRILATPTLAILACCNLPLKGTGCYKSNFLPVKSYYMEKTSKNIATQDE